MAAEVDLPRAEAAVRVAAAEVRIAKDAYDRALDHRDGRIRDAIDAGSSVAQCSRDAGVSHSLIIRIRDGHRTLNREPELQPA